jgi:hypothetical protein
MLDALVRLLEMGARNFDKWSEPVEMPWPRSALWGFVSGAIGGLASIALYRALFPFWTRYVPQFRDVLPSLGDGLLGKESLGAAMLGGAGACLLFSAPRIVQATRRVPRWVVELMLCALGAVILILAQMVTSGVPLDWPWPPTSLGFSVFGVTGMFTLLRTVRFERLRGVTDAIVGALASSVLSFIAYGCALASVGYVVLPAALTSALVEAVYIFLIIVIGYTSIRLTQPTAGRIYRS